MCKHVAAVLYGVGARLDEQPELLFRLRAVDENELVANIDQALPMSKTSPAAGKLLDVDDLSAMFGLDMAGVRQSGRGCGRRGAQGRKARAAGGSQEGHRQEGHQQEARSPRKSQRLSSPEQDRSAAFEACGRP